MGERAMRVTMPDGSQWDVPLGVIVENRRAYYVGTARENERDPDDDEIQDWAANNMDWRDVARRAVKVKDRPALTPDDFQEGWVNGDREIVEPVEDPNG